MRNCAGNGRCKLCLKFFVKTPHHTLRFSVSRRSCTRQTWLEFKESSFLKMTPKFWTFVLKVFALFVLVWMLLASLIASLSLIDRSVLLDHKMIVEGIQYHEKKELQRFFDEDGVEISNLSHMRSIGDQTYTANQKIVDGEVKDETIETTLAEDEVAAFKKDWEDNWHPMIGERSTGVMKTFFKKLDDFLN